MAEINHDPLLPWLRSVKTALRDFNLNSESNIRTLVSDCITKFKDDARYRDDLRFLKIWFIHLGFAEDYGSVYSEMLEKKICVGHSMLYVWYGWFLEFEEKLYEAHMVYQMGIMRNAEPVEWLKKAQASFLERMNDLANNSSPENVDDGESMESEESYVNPWSSSTMKELSRKTMKKIMGYRGCHSSSKACPGKVAVSTVQNMSKKLLEIGRKKYQIKGCAGQGGFAQVYRAYVNSNSEDVVALKIQNPPFPWEFYMYRQLDHRIASEERQSFGFAHQMHLYSDCSILVCDFLGSGTLQDAINAYAVIGKSMEEVLCIYYTIEMLNMLEALHGAAIIHGDFKPDNLLIRYARDDLVEDEFRSRSGSWRDQGLCLVDWGRGIDLSLFPDGTEFKGDCRTSGFRCIEMQCNRPWKFQVDTYGVCVIVHMMLHNQYMEIQEKALPDGGSVYLPKSTLRRYWNVDLWKNLFTKLLNYNNDKESLRSLRESFQGYMCSNPQLLKKLKELLVKQRASLCSA